MLINPLQPKFICVGAVLAFIHCGPQPQPAETLNNKLCMMNDCVCMDCVYWLQHGLYLSFSLFFFVRHQHANHITRL